jgi:hypothetical protein
MALKTLKASEVKINQVIVVGADNYTVNGVFRLNGCGVVHRIIRCRDREGLLVTFTFEPDDDVMAVYTRDYRDQIESGRNARVHTARGRQGK